MAFDQLHIANRMLFRVGSESITSFTAGSESTKPQRLIVAIYDSIVEEVFNLNIPWKFATTRKELTEITPVPVFGYDHQFAAPPGYVRIIKTVDENAREINYPYKKEVLLTVVLKKTVETDVFLTDQESMFVEYVYLRANPAAWPGWFRKLVILSGAKELVGPVKKDDFTMLSITRDLKEATLAAKGANGAEDMNTSNEDVDVDLGSDDFVMANQDPEGVDRRSPYSLNRS